MGYKLEKKIGALKLKNDSFIDFNNYVGDEFTYKEARDGKSKKKWLDGLRDRIASDGEAEAKRVQIELEKFLKK
jgi:hypothetical protein